MTGTEIRLSPDDELRMFLPPRRRDDPSVTAGVAENATLGHVVESAGFPLPEVGTLEVDGRVRPASYRPVGGELVRVGAVRRPQPVEWGGSPRFLLDVHLGALARRMRLVGLDTAYHNDCDDPVLVDQANAEHRVLLTQDRGLLRRRRLWLGAYVRGTHGDRQLADVLSRFDPPLAPWTRCPACNGLVHTAPREQVEGLVQPGTREAFDSFVRCSGCDRVYWRGAHADRLEAIVAEATGTAG